MALDLSPDSPTSSGFDRIQRPSGQSFGPAVCITRTKSADTATNSALLPNEIKNDVLPTLLDVSKAKTSARPAKTPPRSRSPKDKSVQALPTIRMEGPSPTRQYSYSSTLAVNNSKNISRRPWRKLMWVKQNYPDNYTDASFLESLQRNVNLQAYDFWSLVYDTTVIIQHISTVVIFVCIFIAISLRKITPEYLAATSTALTIVGWLIWDEWNEEEQALIFKAQEAIREATKDLSPESDTSPTYRNNKISRSSSSVTIKSQKGSGKSKNHEIAATATDNPNSITESLDIETQNGDTSEYISLNGSLKRPVSQSQISLLNHEDPPSPTPPPPPTRANRRLSTLKSAILIYSTLLGLSPILKSLTKTTTSDSIWALSSWLFLINLLCFDYGLGEGEADLSKKGIDGMQQGLVSPNIGTLTFRKKLPTSLSTTTALAASVVLASRLAQTRDVFSLLLFSIQIFGLFPLFRRRVRYLSSTLHLTLTMTLIFVAGAALFSVLNWQWLLMWLALVFGGGTGAAWVLMGMQRYKNEIRGPWDPARPIFSKR